MKRALAVALVLVTAVPSAAWAGKDDDEEESSDDEESADKPDKKADKADKKADKEDKDDEESKDDESSDDESTDDEDSAPNDKAKSATKEEDEEVDSDAGLRPKQDLSGHDLGTNKKSNEFERDRFFVDKVDSEKTEKGTLVQGSLASSSFFYKETGGAYPSGTPGSVGNNAGPSRLFTELRLQTDFRHISAGRWEARVDARTRFVNSQGIGAAQTPENHIQSGLTGQNEYELRELWLTRVGKRSDIFIGRQFIPDLGGVKIDGLRVDYAKSAKLTLIYFGGLFPTRGSRSITTDYPGLKDPNGNPAGKFVGTGGFGAAYRTINSYGSVGGVAQVPFQKEQPRFFVTSSGYLRSGAKLDIYHFVLLDLLGAAATASTGHVALTNLSAGINYKPDARLRLTANVNRVDTETLNVQAGEFLNTVDTKAGDATYGGNNVVQNESYLIRLASQQARGGVSAGLGKQQRFELSTAVTYRERQAFTLSTPTVMGVPATLVNLPAAKAVEIWGSFVDRRSYKGARIGLDASRSFGVGSASYQRSNTQTVRLFVLKEIRDGRGEVETEVSYAKVLNDTGSAVCTGPIAMLASTCYGNSTNTLVSAGAQLVYRLKADWLAIGNLYLLRTTNTSPGPTMGTVVDDPATIGFTGFIRIAKRF